MLPPWLVLAAVASLTLALGYQLLSKRYGWRVLLYWVVVLAAVLGAEAGAEALGLNIVRIGDLRIIPDAAGGLVALTVLWFLGI